MIKDKEYESLGENIFPIEYLSDEEKKELGVLEKKCCKSKGGGCNGCSVKSKQESSCKGCTGCSK